MSQSDHTFDRRLFPARKHLDEHHRCLEEAAKQHARHTTAIRENRRDFDQRMERMKEIFFDHKEESKQEISELKKELRNAEDRMHSKLSTIASTVNDIKISNNQRDHKTTLKTAMIAAGATLIAPLLLMAANTLTAPSKVPETPRVDPYRLELLECVEKYEGDPRQKCLLRVYEKQIKHLESRSR